MNNMELIYEIEETKTKTFPPFDCEKWSSFFSDTFPNTTPSAARVIPSSATTIAKRVLWHSESCIPAEEKESVRSIIEVHTGYDIELWIPSESLIFYWHFTLEEYQKKMQAFHGPKGEDWIVSTYKDCRLEEFEKVYKPTLEKFASFSQMKENWDSYEAIPPKYETMRRSIDVLFYLYKELANEGERMPLPFVAPCSDGSIQFEWEKENKEIDLIIPPDLMQPMSIAWSFGQDVYELDIISIIDVLNRLRWLLKA